MPARVELLCHECDVDRAMAATSRALDRVETLGPRLDRVELAAPRDRFDVFATCPADWDASKVAVGLPQHMVRERRDFVGALLSQHYMPGWGVATWVLHRQQPPESRSIPYRDSSFAIWPASMTFQVDWLPGG